MANLSQQKRERMLAFLNKVKEEHQDDDEVLQALDEIETELNSKKYGLVWEKHEEEVDRMMQDNIPVFTEVKEREIKAKDENAYNFLLEGDNLHSLKLLEKTHAGKIDVIYIDPPYNTGKEFVYNDALIVTADSYKHSKWLSFMNSRLHVAKTLLSDKGVIFLSIDDNEFSQLKLLCDGIFGEENNIASFCIIRAEGGGMAKQVIKGHDYCLAYAKNISTFTPLAKQKDVRGKIVEKEGSKYWIQEDWLRKQFGKYGNCHYEEILKYKGEKVKEEIDEGLKKGYYTLIKKSNGMHIVGKLRNLESDNSKFYSILKHLNKNGVNELKQLGIKFDYPKPSSLIKELIGGATFFKQQQNATVLDFFAGSGTTAQAVLELNKEDGGNRKFILCTNNENNICEEVTYERIKRVIHGYADVEGIPANLKYFKTDFVSKDADDVSSELLQHIKEMVELENGITLDNKHYLIVLTDEEADALAKNWSSYEDVRAIYVSRDVLLTTEQQACFAGAEIHVIPDYYFEYELKEVGEAW